MKFIAIMVMVLCVVSCGKNSGSSKSNDIVSIFNEQLVTDNPRLLSLDMRGVTVGVEQLASDLLGDACALGTLKGTLPVGNTVSNESVKVDGNTKQGVITFGKLKGIKSASQNDPCAVMSTESFSYRVVGEKVLLTNIKYNVVDVYTRK